MVFKDPYPHPLNFLDLIYNPHAKKNSDLVLDTNGLYRSHAWLLFHFHCVEPAADKGIIHFCNT